MLIAKTSYFMRNIYKDNNFMTSYGVSISDSASCTRISRFGHLFLKLHRFRITTIEFSLGEHFRSRYMLDHSLSIPNLAKMI